MLNTHNTFFIKERLQLKCFPVKFATFLKIRFFTEHTGACFDARKACF